MLVQKNLRPNLHFGMLGRAASDALLQGGDGLLCEPSLLFAIGRSELHGHRFSRMGGRHNFFLLHALEDVLALAQEAIASAHVFCHCCATCMYNWKAFNPAI
jgi:hypothetical protein